jgi:hypothetical protein
MSFHYWQYFLAIETSLIKTIQYVDLTPNNYKTYSIEFARIFLSASSEIDVICKLLCEKIDPTKRAENINDYRNIITIKYPNFYSMKVLIPKYGIELTPWAKWENQKNPDWWKKYNNVKHERNAHFQDANLKNNLDSVAGLFCLVLYYYQRELYEFKLKPWTQLLSLENEPGYLLLETGYKLPDF